MSVKVMGAVWDCDLPQNEKLVLLALADHADHDGEHIFPSMGRLAWKTGYSKRSVQTIMRKLEDRGIIQQYDVSEFQTKMYKILIERLPGREPYKGGENSAPPTNGGENSAPGGVKSLHGGGENSAPKSSVVNRQDQPLVNEEEDGTAEIFQMYHAKIGVIGQECAVKLKSLQDEYPHKWVIEAIEAAGNNGARHVNYIEKVLLNRDVDEKRKKNGKSKSSIPTAEEINSWISDK